MKHFAIALAALALTFAGPTNAAHAQSQAESIRRIETAQSLLPFGLANLELLAFQCRNPDVFAQEMLRADRLDARTISRLSVRGRYRTMRELVREESERCCRSPFDGTLDEGPCDLDAMNQQRDRTRAAMDRWENALDELR